MRRSRRATRVPRSTAPIGWGERSEPQHALRAGCAPSGFHAFTPPHAPIRKHHPHSGKRRSARLGCAKRTPTCAANRTWIVGIPRVHPDLCAGPTTAIHPTHDTGKRGVLGFAALTPTYALRSPQPMRRSGSAAPIGWGERSEPQHALRAGCTPSGFHAFTQPMRWPNASHPSDARLRETRSVGFTSFTPTYAPIRKRRPYRGKRRSDRLG